MPAGTGLSLLAKELPRQFFDVGIAEEHAVLFAAGLATKGFRPVCAIYSTFLQRAYDQVIHDVCLQNLPVTFCMDRAGLSANDGPTHHGLFDISFLRCVPNATVMQPKDEDELVDMLHTCLHLPGPGFIRYPRGAGTGIPIKAEPVALSVGQAESLKVGTHIIIWAIGNMVPEALKLSAQLEREFHISVGVVNARFIKPLDRNLLLSQAAVVPLIVTMEDHVLSGGFGSAVIEALQEGHCPTPVERIGWPDTFVEHGSSVDILRAAHGLSPEDMFRQVSARWRGLQSLKPVVDA
jgi:1-deoxy-D-xylulose-5-phosphate synthase